MSQSKIDVPHNIKTIITLDDAGEPQAVAVSGVGHIPNSGLSAIAQQALTQHLGPDHGYLVMISPVATEGNETVFEVYKRRRFDTQPGLR